MTLYATRPNLPGKWLLVTRPYATFALEIDERDVVIAAPPITKWTIGKTLTEVQAYFKLKGATVELIINTTEGFTT